MSIARSWPWCICRTGDLEENHLVRSKGNEAFNIHDIHTKLLTQVDGHAGEDLRH